MIENSIKEVSKHEYKVSPTLKVEVLEEAVTYTRQTEPLRVITFTLYRFVFQTEDGGVGEWTKGVGFRQEYPYSFASRDLERGINTIITHYRDNESI